MKKSFNILLLFAFAMSLTVWSCKPTGVTSETAEAVEEAIEEVEQFPEEEEIEQAVEEVEGKCDYNEIKGKATISKLNFSNMNEVVIHLNFSPNEEDVSIYPEVSNKNIPFAINGLNKYPSKDWCAKNGIKKGVSYNCVRYELSQDSKANCEHVKFSMIDFEDSGL